jgi:5-methylcytosine-specific restriction enzyme A
LKDFNLRTSEGRQLFYRSTEWRKLRAIKVAENPLCEECLKKGILTPTKEVHHIKDISDIPTLENALNYNNLMSLCKPCHSKITGHKEKAVWKPFNLKEFLNNRA